MTHLRQRALPLLSRACALRPALALPTWPRTVDSVRSLGNTAAQCARSSTPGPKGVDDSLRRPRGVGADGEALSSRLIVQDSVEVIRERLSQSRFSSSAGSRPPEAGWDGGAASLPSEVRREIGKAEIAVRNAADSIIFAVDVLERLAQMLERATAARQAEPAAEVEVVEQEAVEAEVLAEAAKTKNTAPQTMTTTTTKAPPQTMEEAIAGLRNMVLEKEEGNGEEQPTTEDAVMTEKQKKKALKKAKALRKAERRAKQAAAKKARLEVKRERRKAREEAELRKLEARKYPGNDISTLRDYHEAFRDIDPEEHDGADEEGAEVAAAGEDEGEEAVEDEEESGVADAGEDEVEEAAADEEEVEVVAPKPLTMAEKRRARNEAAAAKREAGKVRARERKAKKQAFHAQRAQQKQSRRASRKLGGADRALLNATEEELAKTLWPDNDGGKP
ncbi:hypothetical protein MAPG_08386 [Magnaporthiopsis poae ATCC 64411]|uniref:Uncharacterized protein n=1 Tax=Magnaporthiopsis poae (strain ATCC 64411 / 73-15) TaxID=644358 RepID=A0A0C4E783_MAGP6|nr:hypothetical protein MAPG_08386 [Magnaporthiopsis poae ATCC 64411]